MVKEENKRVKEDSPVDTPAEEKVETQNSKITEEKKVVESDIVSEKGTKEIEKDKEASEEAVVAETEVNEVENETIENKENVEQEEQPNAASFQKGTNSKMPLIVIVVAIVGLAGVLFIRNLNPSIDLVAGANYENAIHGYSYTYPQDMQLVAAGNIPAELVLQGVESMAQLNLTDGDSLLVRSDEVSGDNIVYTTLELSSRQNFVNFDTYKESLLASLDESKEINSVDYTIVDGVVGENILSTEYSFEMEVPVDEEGNTRTGVFYDNIFQTEDGKAYSISFGYPKDVEDAAGYLTIYRNLLASFEIGGNVIEVPVEISDETEEVSDGAEVVEEVVE